MNDGKYALKTGEREASPEAGNQEPRGEEGKKRENMDTRRPAVTVAMEEPRGGPSASPVHNQNTRRASSERALRRSRESVD